LGPPSGFGGRVPACSEGGVVISGDSPTANSGSEISAQRVRNARLVCRRVYSPEKAVRLLFGSDFVSIPADNIAVACWCLFVNGATPAANRAAGDVCDCVTEFLVVFEAFGELFLEQFNRFRSAVPIVETERVAEPPAVADCRFRHVASVRSPSDVYIGGVALAVADCRFGFCLGRGHTIIVFTPAAYMLHESSGCLRLAGGIYGAAC